jgi:hypothetical protein
LSNAWRTANNDENADLCNKNYLQMWKTSTGAYYNIIIDEKKYLIQSNWNLATNSCTMIDKFTKEDRIH